MRYRELGTSGLKVSVVGLGTNAFGGRADRETSIRVLHRAVDAGINFIDTANIYAGTKSEEVIGEAFEGRRDDVILATKAGMRRGDGPNDRGSSRHHLLREVEGSLRRLRTDYIDVYQIHAFDPQTPLEETMRALDDLITSGKIRYIGASNYRAWQLMKALSVSERLGLAKYISVQPNYSLADRTIEQELLPLCVDQGIGIIPYRPLAGGILSGKRPETAGARPVDPDHLALGERVASLAESLGTSATALSIAWLMSRPAVSTVIAGTSRDEHLDENLEAVDLVVPEETLTSLNELSEKFVYARPPVGGPARPRP